MNWEAIGAVGEVLGAGDGGRESEARAGGEEAPESERMPFHDCGLDHTPSRTSPAAGMSSVRPVG